MRLGRRLALLVQAGTVGSGTEGADVQVALDAGLPAGGKGADGQGHVCLFELRPVAVQDADQIDDCVTAGQRLRQGIRIAGIHSDNFGCRENPGRCGMIRPSGQDDGFLAGLGQSLG